MRERLRRWSRELRSRAWCKMTLREALLAMGYTEKKPGIWLKPVGYQLFQFKEEGLMWVNWFKALNGEVAMWQKKILSPDEKQKGTYLKQLKEVECFTRTDVYVNGSSEFEIGGVDV